MSHFYGKLNGSRGPATRCATKKSGLTTVAASWDGAIEVNLTYNGCTGKNEYVVAMRPWQGRGNSVVLAEGEF